MRWIVLGVAAVLFALTCWGVSWLLNTLVMVR